MYGRLLNFFFFSAAITLTTTVFADGSRSVPIIYSTDLYHPHDDPDDHFDLATLYAVPEFDILGIVIDRGERGADRPGVCAIQQMNHITGRDVPYALGLTHNLASPTDRGENQPGETCGGIELILNGLRQSQKPVTLFIIGSLRDIAAAYNREPELFAKKVSRMYVNAGHSSGGNEWNVDLDRHAYFRILGSSLPVYWMPCFGDNGYLTFWKFQHSQVLDSVPLAVQNFFIYALKKSDPKTADPIEALKAPIALEDKEQIWKNERNMWCTAGFLHAAGRANETFTFEKKPVRLDEANAKTTVGEQGIELYTFHQSDKAAYTRSMTETLRGLLAGLQPQGGSR